MTDVTILDIFVNFGREGGKGADSIIKAAMFATGCAAQKMVTDKDAADLYAAYRTGFDGEVMLSDNLIRNDQAKVQISCFKTFLKDEVVKNGEIHGRALQLRAKIDPANRKHSAYNGLVALNRAQVKKGMVALTNAEITAVLEKDTPEGKSDLEKLIAQRKVLQKLDDSLGGLLDALVLIDRRIQALQAEAMIDNEEPEGDDETAAPNSAVADLLKSVNAMAGAVTH
jgi:hypothetical protein